VVRGLSTCATPEKRVRIELQEGDVVDRHLLNGDRVLFNRPA
jgi:hypothetical protein